jgi:hypothetical protein
MDVILRAVIGFFLMLAAGVVGDAVWGDDWTAVGFLIFALGLPLLVMTFLLLPDYRWTNTVAGAAGLAVGVGAVAMFSSETSDSGAAILWLYVPMYVAMAFGIYWVMGVTVKAVHELVGRG